MRLRSVIWLTLGGLGLPVGAVTVAAVVVVGFVVIGMGGALSGGDPNAPGATEETTGNPPVLSGQAPPPGVVSGSVGAPDPSRIGASSEYTAPAAIDYDGDPKAYAPEGSGLPTSDYLANAGRPGNWWGIETDTGKPSGNPKIGPDGYYISQTSLKIGGKSLNSQSVPFVALPRNFAGAKLGDYVLLVNNETGAKCWTIYGDVSPRQAKVEMSPAAARELGVGFNKRGTTSNAGSITATVYPGTANLSNIR